MGSSPSYLQNLELAGVDLAKVDLSNVKVVNLDDWCYRNDSTEALKICSPMQMSGGKMKIKMDHLPHTMMTNTVVPAVNLTTVPVQLQELNGFTNWVKKEENKAKAAFKKVNWKDLGIDAWHGITACYSNPKCKAAVEKYGLKAVEDAGEDAVEVAALQNLNGFTNWVKSEENKAKIDFHKAAAEVKKLALGAWVSTEHCYATPKCKAAVEKYGLLAVKIAAGVALAPVGALQNMPSCPNGDCMFLQEMPSCPDGHCAFSYLQNMPSCPNGDCMFLQNMPSCPNGDCMFMI